MFCGTRGAGIGDDSRTHRTDDALKKKLDLRRTTAVPAVVAFSRRYPVSRSGLWRQATYQVHEESRWSGHFLWGALVSVLCCVRLGSLHSRISHGRPPTHERQMVVLARRAARMGWLAQWPAWVVDAATEAGRGTRRPSAVRVWPPHRSSRPSFSDRTGARRGASGGGKRARRGNSQGHPGASQWLRFARRHHVRTARARTQPFEFPCLDTKGRRSLSSAQVKTEADVLHFTVYQRSSS